MINFFQNITASKKSDSKLRQGLKTMLGFNPGNVALYQQAFMHSSSRENRNNERLEFLGDAVLGAVVADYLFKLFPLKDEGFLTRIRSKIVNRRSMQQLAVKFGLEEYVKTSLSHSEKSKSSVYGDAFEALIGAIYLDKGFATVKKFIINRIVKVHLDIEELMQNDTDYKSQLQIYAQKRKLPLEYRLINETQQGGQKIFEVQVYLGKKPYVAFEHYSKKIAEQKAAQLSLELLSNKD